MKSLLVFCLLFATAIASAADKIFYIKTQPGTRDQVIAALTPLGFELYKINSTNDWITVIGPDKIGDLRSIPQVILAEGDVQFHLFDSAEDCPTKLE